MFAVLKISCLVIYALGAAGALGSALVRHLVGEGHKVVALDTPRGK